MKPTFILGSSSPRRRELLASLGIAFTITKPHIDESQRNGEPPHDYVQRLSREKAAAVAAQVTQVAEPALVLAADTVVILAADTIGVTTDGHILGKPVDAADAKAMLQRLRGRSHQVCTALTLAQVAPDGDGQAAITRQNTTLTCTQVFMRDYSDAEIDAYIATGDPFDKAGSYAIQHEGFAPVARIEGSRTNVVGLPLETLRAMLAELGWQAN